MDSLSKEILAEVHVMTTNELANNVAELQAKLNSIYTAEHARLEQDIDPIEIVFADTSREVKALLIGFAVSLIFGVTPQ